MFKGLHPSFLSPQLAPPWQDAFLTFSGNRKAKRQLRRINEALKKEQEYRANHFAQRADERSKPASATPKGQRQALKKREKRDKHKKAPQAKAPPLLTSKSFMRLFQPFGLNKILAAAITIIQYGKVAGLGGQHAVITLDPQKLEFIPKTISSPTDTGNTTTKPKAEQGGWRKLIKFLGENTVVRIFRPSLFIENGEPDLRSTAEYHSLCLEAPEVAEKPFGNREMFRPQDNLAQRLVRLKTDKDATVKIEFLRLLPPGLIFPLYENYFAKKQPLPDLVEGYTHYVKTIAKVSDNGFVKYFRLLNDLSGLEKQRTDPIPDNFCLSKSLRRPKRGRNKGNAHVKAGLELIPFDFRPYKKEESENFWKTISGMFGLKAALKDDFKECINTDKSLKVNLSGRVRLIVNRMITGANRTEFTVSANSEESRKHKERVESFFEFLGLKLETDPKVAETDQFPFHVVFK